MSGLTALQENFIATKTKLEQMLNRTVRLGFPHEFNQIQVALNDLAKCHDLAIIAALGQRKGR